MASWSTVNICGRLGRDAELKHLPSGTCICEFSVAVSENYKDREGNPVEKTTWINCVGFGPFFEKAAARLIKGATIAFSGGKLRVDEWEKDGQKRSKMLVELNNATKISVFSRGGDERDATNHGSSPAPAGRGNPPARKNPEDYPDTMPDEDNIPF
jgi:single-strand DNA-binding protein